MDDRQAVGRQADGRQALGRYGEQLAVEHLQAVGLQVLARNWRCREGEIDVVARSGSTLVFVSASKKRCVTRSAHAPQQKVT